MCCNDVLAAPLPLLPPMLTDRLVPVLLGVDAGRQAQLPSEGGQ
jgi:hypothetical protein